MHPQKAVEILTAELPKRSGAVLEKRFGLGKTGKRQTLEAIGKGYGITRERVRQIERDSIIRIKKSAAYKDVMPVFFVFEEYITQKGGIVAEDQLVRQFDTDGKSQNHIVFLLTLAPAIDHKPENDELASRWITNTEKMTAVENALNAVHADIEQSTSLLSRDELVSKVQNHMEAHNVSADSDELDRYIGISKCIGENCFGQWGHASSSLVRPRGVRDMAYLVFQREGKPLHFLSVANLIRDLVAERSVHAQTVHNELIKDSRFVLVGRGMYGLREWGYEPGTVRDIIMRMLRKDSLTKEEIVDKVLDKRQVKANTILINLQNKKFFKKLSDGRYTAVA